MSVITLTLLLPGKAVPVQSWTFETESVVRVGRAADSDVVLYSAVVSRHHLEIRQVEAGWEVVNLGANGAYINGEAIAKITVQDGMIIRLASSGPKIQIYIEPQVAPTKQKMMKLQPPQATTPIEVPHDPTKETVVN
jgi:pSer/pThr/pTyr-binding forkhead associated (FHA) protein